MIVHSLETCEITLVGAGCRVHIVQRRRHGLGNSKEAKVSARQNKLNDDLDRIGSSSREARGGETGGYGGASEGGGSNNNSKVGGGEVTPKHKPMCNACIIMHACIWWGLAWQPP